LTRELGTREPGHSGALSPGAAVALLAFCVPLWGFNWPVMKIVLVDIAPLWLGAIRLAATGAVLFVVLALSRRLRMPNRDDAPALISVGVFMFGIYSILTMVGLSHAQAGRAAILTFVTPLWVTPLARAVQAVEIACETAWSRSGAETVADRVEVAQRPAPAFCQEGVRTNDPNIRSVSIIGLPSRQNLELVSW